MGLWDIEVDEDDFLDGNYVYEDNNIYLAKEEAAIELISRIIPIKKNDFISQRTINKLDNMIDIDFLSAFRHIQLNNEAQLQMKLSMLSDKLLEKKKYEKLKDKSVVGIGGKFSAGKSKFINSILKAEEELLPEDQNPTTSIPTYIVYDKNEEISAYIVDNEKVILDIDSLHALTHKFYEKYKVSFSSFINSLIISEPNMPYKELVFLDTPGYSKADSDKKKKELTDENKAYVQLKGVDYLIWLMDIENGVLTENDISFINKIQIDTPILIVVNKADKKLDKEIEEIINLVKITANNAGIKVFAVTAYSSRDGKEWRNNNYITEFLEKASIKKINKDDLNEQIRVINKIISEDIKKKLESNIKERNNLSDIIFKSDDILEIKALIDLYSDSMEEIRNLKECKKIYEYKVNKIMNALDDYYSRK